MSKRVSDKELQDLIDYVNPYSQLHSVYLELQHLRKVADGSEYLLCSYCGQQSTGRYRCCVHIFCDELCEKQHKKEKGCSL